MLLRRKFGLLALIYVLSLTVNLVMSGWCIIVYFQSAFESFQSELGKEQTAAHIRQLVDEQRRLVQQGGLAGEAKDDFEAIHDHVSAALSMLEEDSRDPSLAPLWPRIHQAARRVGRIAERYAQAPDSRPAGATVETADLEAFAELDRLLGEAAGAFRQQRQAGMRRADTTQQRVVTILLANTACGAVLCALGLLFVRRWVLQPVADLREATRQIARGNLDHRVEPRSKDELGRLAAEVNQMAATIVAMQTKLIEQERLAAAGEMVNRLAHNIRNPLAGIRGLAEATAQQHADSSQTVECQQRIIDTVDRFEKWLRDLQESVAPMKLNLQPVRISDLIDNVIKALRPMFDRREIDARVEVAPGVSLVQLDSMHFEQALVALVTNAVQASDRGQTVWVRAAVTPDRPDHWSVTVEDQGLGIPPEIRDRIFMPYFTTRKGGNGIGLAIAIKVVKIHGGQLTVDSEPGRGSRFTATMPGLVQEV